MAEKVRLERGKIAVDEARKAKLALQNDLDQKSKEIADMTALMKERETKLAEAQKAQADLLRKQRELDDAKRELELPVGRRVQEGLATTREQAKKEAEEGLKLKVLEKEQTIASMQKQIEELKRRAEQGSQQLQGEVQELSWKLFYEQDFQETRLNLSPKANMAVMRYSMLWDQPGNRAGRSSGNQSGPRTGSDGWLAKLRDHQRAANAEIAVIVSQSLPKEIETFGLVENVWVTHAKTVLPVALTLRHTLIEVASVRQASEGQRTKTEMV